ncbi:lipopolysaccharide biosynthesis protein [Nonomuraea sp. NPDC049480]|uniref:lipopolysaccharide biosynthesis protein n=1 Tax=Nonomuraea sp. NPDC049480 TaxID=3364353 RepID=UPI00378BD870
MNSSAVVVHTLISRAIRLVLAMATGVLLARTLQPEGRGVYAVIATAAGAAIVVGHLSVEKSQIALWSDRSRHQALTTNGLFLGLSLGFVSALGALALASASGSPGGFALWALAMAVVPLGAAAINLDGILMLQSRMGFVNRTTLLSALSQCLPILFLAAIDRVTITSVIICWAISTALPFARDLRGLRPMSFRWDRRLVRRQLSLSGKYHVGWVALHFLVSIDVLLLNTLDSPAAVGIYTVAVTVSTLARVPGETITQVILPRQAAGDVADAGHVTARALRINILISSASVGVIAGASPWLIPVVYGQSFAPSVAPLLALAPGTIALMLVRPLEQYLVRVERPTRMCAISVSALALNLLLNLAMIPHWGALGAALASTVAYVLMGAMEASRFLKSTGLAVRELIPGTADVRLLLRPLAARMRRGVAVP